MPETMAFVSENMSENMSENLFRWGCLESKDCHRILQHLSLVRGPEVVYQLFSKHIDRASTSSLYELVSRAPSIISSIRREARDFFPGWRYASKPVVTFCLMACSSSLSPSNPWDTYLWRLARGGLLDFRLEKVKGLYCIESPFPLLMDQMATVLRMRRSLIGELLMHANIISFDNPFAIWINYILLELVQRPASRLWRWLGERHGLELMFSEAPKNVSALEALYAESHKETWFQRSLDENRVCIFSPHESDREADRELAFAARSGGAPCYVLLRLLHVRGAESLHMESRFNSVTATPQCTAPPDDTDGTTGTERSTSESTSKWNVASIATMSELLRFDKIIDVTESDVPLPLSDCSATSSIDCTVAHLHNMRSGDSLFGRLFKGLRIKTPWCDMSRRSRVYNHYMCENLTAKYTSGRMALRQHKATGLSYMANAEEIISQLHVSRYELSLYRAYSVSVGSRLEIPETESVKSVRVLIRLLIAWGTGAAEVIETRKLLKRNRIFRLDRATQPDRLIESSQLALGTKLAIKAVLRSVRPPAKTSLSL